MTDIVNVGTAANAGNGDPLRTAFAQINRRFTELALYSRGDWAPATAYTATPRREWVMNDGTAYVAVINHTSGGSFAADLAAGKWLALDVAQLIADLAGPGGAAAVGHGDGTVQDVLDSVNDDIAASKKYPVLSGETGVANQFYEYGDLRRYGAAAGTDCSAAISAAFDVSTRLGYDVLIPAGRWHDTVKRTVNSEAPFNQGLVVKPIGEPKECVIVLDASITGAFWLDVVGNTASLHDSRATITCRIEVPSNTGLTSGVIRFIDALAAGAPNTQIIANGSLNGPTYSIPIEGVRFENSQLFCESWNMDGYSYYKLQTGCRFVPSTEVVADRYRTVTTGTTSFLQGSARKAEGHAHGPGATCWKINGSFSRCIFEAGGWPKRPGASIFDIASTAVLGTATFITPWSDPGDIVGGAGDTPCGLFHFRGPQYGGTIINPSRSGFQFDYGDLDNYFGSKNYQGKVIGVGSPTDADNTTAGTGNFESLKGIPRVSDSKWTSFEDDFWKIDPGIWVTTGTVALSGSAAHSALMTATSGRSGIVAKAVATSNPARADNFFGFEVRFSVSNLAAQKIYIGLCRDGGFVKGSLVRDSYWITNVDTSNNASTTLSFVSTDSTPAEISRISAGVIATGTNYVVRMLHSRESGEVDCFVNDVKVGSITRMEFNKFINISCETLATTETMTVDYVRFGGLRTM